MQSRPETTETIIAAMPRLRTPDLRKFNALLSLDKIRRQQAAKTRTAMPTTATSGAEARLVASHKMPTANSKILADRRTPMVHRMVLRKMVGRADRRRRSGHW